MRDIHREMLDWADQELLDRPVSAAKLREWAEIALQLQVEREELIECLADIAFPAIRKPRQKAPRLFSPWDDPLF